MVLKAVDSGPAGLPNGCSFTGHPGGNRAGPVQKDVLRKIEISTMPAGEEWPLNHYFSMM